MPHDIAITPEDISSVAQVFGCDFDDGHCLEVLRCTACRDIQACAGSGKTTVLVAKLAILSEKWRWRDRGICVLSHTNVARHEVEKHLASHPTAHRLLNYPHFIGTIQAFVDQFLALPFLRSRGIDVVAVDNERFEARVWRLLRYYRYLGTFLQRRPRSAGAILTGLRYEGESLELGSAGGSIPVRRGTRTYDELLDLKDRIYQEGVFRYDDMYAFAQAYLKEYSALPEIVSARFPWVFVDEMQDTNVVQDSLLCRLFADGSILQRLGDVNQGIYDETDTAESRTSFPLPDALDLPQSRRFGRTIASFASRLTVVVPQEIQGDPNCPDRSHTVFLFDKDSVSGVLPAFGDLLFRTYPQGIPNGSSVKAIGYRKSPGDADRNQPTPYSIGDYWARFRPNATSKSTRPHRLIEFVDRARRTLRHQREWYDAYDLLVGGAVEFLHRQNARTDSGLWFTKTRLIDAMRERDSACVLTLQELLLELGTRHPLSEEYWRQATSALVNLLSPWNGPNLTPEAMEFLRWRTSDRDAVCEVASEGTGRSLLNTYRYENSEGFKADIEVTTIHAVKGETHLATLVLETYWYDHDLAELMPLITGQGDRRDYARRARSRRRAKHAFVAMTRPRELLCLAMNKSHLEEDRLSALINSGWMVQDLTNGNG